MSQDDTKCIGLLIGREKDWPEAFIRGVQSRKENITAELVKIGGTYMDHKSKYPVIIDRMSHEIPYYRVYVKFAAMHDDSYVINDPFVWSADTSFFGTALANKLNMLSPRTVALPNKDIETDVVPDSFRNLVYPMDWDDIINYVGVPAIFKEIRSGGRRISYRVNNVDELIQRYDESGTRSMILQAMIDGGINIHCYVIGQEHVLPLEYNKADRRYEMQSQKIVDKWHDHLVSSSLTISRVYGYDINMIEYLLKDDQLFVINATNPAPVIDLQILPQQHFDWLVDKTVDLAIDRVQRPLPQRVAFNIKGN